ncbi:MAG: GreA/GreB family elongation factor [Caldilineaceae bacterium]
MTMDRATSPEQVRIGAHVEVDLIDEAGDCEKVAFDIVREQYADFAKGLLGVQTPLAKAILGKLAGMTVAYTMGDICQVRIRHVSAAAPQVLEDAEARRQAAQQQALNAVERTNAEMFAASYSGKWGDYQLDDQSTFQEPSAPEQAESTENSHA